MRALGWAAALAMCCWRLAVAQGTPPVRGIVTDGVSGTPIAGARVAARSSRPAQTGPDGAFSIIAVPGDTLHAAAIGYGRALVVIRRADSVVSVVLARSGAVLPDIVVTASRREQRAAQTAIAVTSLDQSEIAAAGAASVDRVLGDLPGVQLLPASPTGADLSIRGMDGPRVLVLVDGEPTSGNLLENRDLSRLSTLAVDRVELVKGPLSSLYGSDALGGVVNVVTRDPKGPFALGAQGRVGDGGRREANLWAQSGGTAGFRVSGGVREDQRVASVNQSADALDRVWDLRSTLRVGITPRLHLRSDVSLLRERQRWQLSADGFHGFNDNVGASGWVESIWNLGPDALRSRLYVEHYSHRFRQARSDQPLAADSAERQREELVKATVSYALGVGPHTIDVGADLSHRWIEAPGKVDGTVSDDMVETFAQTGWSLGPVLVNPSARFSWNSRWSTAFTPSLATAWDVTPALRLRAGIARGFRGPSFKELAWDFPNVFAGYTIRGNPDLEPERSWQTNAGASWSVGGGVVVSGEGYRNSIRDLIELTTVGTDGATGLLVFTPLNVTRARTQGVELGVRWAGSDWLASVDYDYLDAKDLQTGLRLDRRATHSALVRLGRDFDWLDGLRADLTLAYTGPAAALQVDGSEGRQDRLLSTNVRAALRLYADTGVEAGVDNLFDERPAGWTGQLGRRFYFGVGTAVQP